MIISRYFRMIVALFSVCLIMTIIGGRARVLGLETEQPPGVYPYRIVCLEPYSAEILCDLEEAGRIVAISRVHDNDPYYEVLKNKPVVGGQYGSNVNLEMVLGVNPDLVFSSSGHVDILRAKGLKTYGTDTYDIEGIMRFIADIGKIIGKEEKASILIAEMESRIQQIEEKVKHVPKKPLVYFEQSDMGKTRGKGSLTHDLITRAGGINIAKDEPVPFPILSQEFIIQANPEVILLEEWGTKPAAIKNRDGWKNIRAVVSDRIFISKSYYTGYTTRCLDGLEEYAKFFHPEFFNQ